MNKSKIVHNSQKNQPLKQYLAFLKSRSKEKSGLQDRKSKSPPQNSISPNHSQNAEDWITLQKKYQSLQEKYSSLLEQVKHRNCEFQKLKSQVQAYKKIHENDREELEKLRCVLGLTKKQSAQTQVEELMLQTHNSNRMSRINKFEQSTLDDIKLKQSQEKFNTKQMIFEFKSDKGIESVLSQKKLIQHNPNYPLYSFKNIAERVGKIGEKSCQNEEQEQQTGRFHKKLSNSPYSKLKFIPKTNY